MYSTLTATTNLDSFLRVHNKISTLNQHPSLAHFAYGKSPRYLNYLSLQLPYLVCRIASSVGDQEQLLLNILSFGLCQDGVCAMICQAVAVLIFY